MTIKKPMLVNFHIFSPQSPLYLFLLIFRWASLLLAMWLFIFTSDAIVPGVSLSLLLAISLGNTLIITILHVPFRLKLFEKPIFLAFDLALSILLLTFSGATRSPYTIYALNPLLAAALFFNVRGAILALGAFSLLYPLTLFGARYYFPAVEVDVGQLLNQLVLAWLVIFLFGSISSILKQLRRANESLTVTHDDLTRRNEELATTYRQLEVIHELTLFLHAPNRESVQQQLLKAITKEFSLPRAVVGVVDESGQRLGQWHIHPPISGGSGQPPLLSLSPGNGPIARAALERQVVWVTETEPLANDSRLEPWFGSGNWFILPMVWHDEPVGVLLMSVEQVGAVDTTDDRWPILTSLVSQASVALGTIDKTRRLAVEQERNRIARDIHDTVAQSLFGIVFTLDACSKMLPGQPEFVKQELVELRNVADKVRQQVRQSVLDLWPTELTQEQFKLDLDKYTRNCCPSKLLRVDYRIEGNFDGLSPALRRGLYRVCQEALSNAARHADVNSARVYLYVEDDKVNLSIRDKGKGFDPRPVLAREKDRDRFGLKGMRERVEGMGGVCDILSQEGEGTQVLVRIPLNGKNGHT